MATSPQIETLRAKLTAASRRVAESREALRSEVPDRLFHYTTSAGLLGMLRSNRLWATNYRFLNDKSEITYGVTLLEKVVGTLLSKADDPVITEVLSRILRTANAFEGMLDCYVSCFCERNDLLHQWRFYAAAGGGYAVGFETREIGRRWGQLHPPQDLVLTRVIYDQDTQTAHIAQVIELAIAELKALLDRDSTVESCNTLIAACCQFVRSHVADYLISFKHPAFAIESEWRLCLTPDPMEEINISFRDGTYGLTPYVEIDPTPMAGINANKLPLAEITHGPVPDPENTRFALNALLRTHGYQIQIDGCELPFRLGP